VLYPVNGSNPTLGQGSNRDQDTSLGDKGRKDKSMFKIYLSNGTEDPMVFTCSTIDEVTNLLIRWAHYKGSITVRANRAKDTLIYRKEQYFNNHSKHGRKIQQVIKSASTGI
jgi:hypothetical protein